MFTEIHLAFLVKKRTIRFSLDIIGTVVKFLAVMTQDFLKQL